MTCTATLRSSPLADKHEHEAATNPVHRRLPWIDAGPLRGEPALDAADLWVPLKGSHEAPGSLLRLAERLMSYAQVEAKLRIVGM